MRKCYSQAGAPNLVRSKDGSPCWFKYAVAEIMGVELKGVLSLSLHLVLSPKRAAPFSLSVVTLPLLSVQVLQLPTEFLLSLQMDEDLQKSVTTVIHALCIVGSFRREGEQNFMFFTSQHSS